jgi:carboxylesterase family protein
VPPHPEGNANNPRPPVGAVHFSEVIYVFNNLRMKDYPWTDLDRKVADTLATYWTNFAKAGSPNGPGLNNWPVPVYTRCWITAARTRGRQRLTLASLFRPSMYALALASITSVEAPRPITRPRPSSN